MRLGIDLGGTKIEGVALDETGEICCRKRLPTPAGSYEETLEAIVELVCQIERQTGRSGTLGIGTPGAVSRMSGQIKNSNSTCLNGQFLREDLTRRLGREVRIANDADCFALSEASDGAGTGHAVVFGVILGTGAGGGIVVNGQLVNGPNAIAGEWGHNPLYFSARDQNSADWFSADRPERAQLLPDGNRRCNCGRLNCNETYISGSGLQLSYQEQGGESLTAVEIAELARNGDPLAERTLQLYQRQLARALASVINILDPDAIVLGGGVSNIDSLYDEVPRLWQPHVFSDRVDTPLLKAKHGDSSGVRGAAWLWP
ncbi:MAG: ROK family protein [Pseudomonadales bacterium]|jgi:fructokinase|nr:ROK family protein [Pseudomonadales bacterium]MCC6530867.1 ROK family protein [Pseudomonadales bacterium]MCP5333762.1 ROK family protein [Pseudomonadales bacterium]HMU90547.1 ROK family protein [Pseudomonadales bacterium]HMW14652.1 ROK family protein [Pseudomonadales bacterium]